jgi:hypothetical protein
MHDDDTWVTLSKFVRCTLAAMRRAVIHNPEHAARGTLWLLGHHLIHQASESGLACARFTATEDLGTMHIPRGQVLQRSTARVFVLDTGRSKWAGRQRRMTAATHLNTRFLISAEHVLVRPERLALPRAGVQIEHWSSELQKARIARKDPAPIAPGPKRIVVEQPPDAAARGARFAVTQRGDLSRDLGQAIPTECHVALGRPLAR